MATIQGGDIADLVKSTLRELGRMKWTDNASALTDHVAMNQLIRKNKVEFGSGYEIQWNVMTDHSSAAKNTGLFAVDNVNVGDVMQTASIPWRHCTTNYAFERREIKMNRTPARIMDLLKIRRSDAMISLAELMESDFWTKPTDSTDTVQPFGVDYWLTPATSGASAGFNGGNPSGFTSGAGNLSSSTYTRWQNWCADYATIDKVGLIREMREAATKTNFKSPVTMPTYDTGRSFGYYTNYNVIQALEEVLEAQNSNLGSDIASKDGVVQFRRVDVTYVPKLDGYSGTGLASATYANPVYGIDWGVFKPVYLSGEYMVESGPNEGANQHTTFQVHVDNSYNFKCTDRRRCFRLDQVS